MPEPRRAPRPSRAKIVTLSRLEPKLRAARRAGRRIVFTNGVFDLLHPGHVQLLERARRLGDLLVVAINTDASVRRLKGPTRPFQGQRDRAAVLAGLEAVDYVITFGDDTPLRAIRRVQPDILVKGGDWKQDEIVGADVVRQRGGRVVRVPVKRGFSTTRIAASIQNRRRR